MSRRLRLSFLAAFLAVSLAAVLQLKFGLAASFYPSFALIALIASAFFLDFLELGFLVVFGAVILNWRPGVTPEILALAGLPIAVYTLRKFLPAQAWLNFTIAVVLGLFVFYSAAGFEVLVKNLNLFLTDLAISAVFAVPIFLILKTLNASKV